MVGLCTRLAIERAGTETPHLQRGAPDFYPNNERRHRPDRCAERGASASCRQAGDLLHNRLLIECGVRLAARGDTVGDFTSGESVVTGRQESGLGTLDTISKRKR